MDPIVTLSDPDGYVAWSDQLARMGGHDTYHLPRYQRLVTPDGYETVLLSYHARGVTLLLPLTLRPLPEPIRRATGMAYDASSVYGYPGPLLAGAVRVDQTCAGGTMIEVDQAWAEEFAAWFGKTCAELSVLTVFVRTHPILDASQAFSAEPFVRSSGTTTVAVDLTRPREERLASASAHHRRALRKSLRHGLRYEQNESEAAVAGFATCYAETMAKHGAETSYLLGADRVTSLLEELGEHAELWVARKPDGAVASAALFLVTGSLIQYHLGGTREEEVWLGASRPLFEAVAQSGHERRLRWLHLGGGVGGADDSLLRYKAGFGPDRFSYRTIRAVLDPAAYDAAVAASGLDPGRGFFPGYRTEGLGV